MQRRVICQYKETDSNKEKEKKNALDEDKGEAICHDNTPANREVFHLEQFFQIRIKFIRLL